MRLVLIILLVLQFSCVNAQTAFPAKYFSFTSQQQSLKMAYVYEKASTPSGKTVVLLHGKNFSFLYWANTIKALLAKGYDVLAPDQVGFGMSSLPEQYQFSFQQLAANTKALVDSLQIEKPIVMGHSIGGMLAIRYALMFPKDCSQLILEDPIGLEDWKVFIPYTAIEKSYQGELKKTKDDLKKYMLQNYFHGEWKLGYDTLLEQCSINLGKKEFAWCMALTTDMMFTQPICYEFANIKVPTVLIVGDRDKTAPGKEKAASDVQPLLGNYPKLAKEAAAKIPSCQLTILKGIGHIPHEEDFNNFIKVIFGELK